MVLPSRPIRSDIPDYLTVTCESKCAASRILLLSGKVETDLRCSLWYSAWQEIHGYITGFVCCLAGRGSLVHSSASPEVQDTDGSPAS